MSAQPDPPSLPSAPPTSPDLLSDSAAAILVRVPASSANLEPGFDALGLSLPLYTTVQVRPAHALQIIPLGEILAGTPADESNYVYASMQALAAEVNQPLPPMRVEIRSDVPLARGLGSSAAALLAGLLAANTVLGEPLDRTEMLHLASRLEGHPDNVAPALLGGIVVGTFDGQQAHVLRIEPPAHLGVTLLIPDFELSTAEARRVMPGHYSQADAVFALSHAALTTAALMSGQLDLLAHAMQDRLHQPYRAPLVPGLKQILTEAPEHGALGVALSGAGPTVLCFHNRTQPTAPLHTFLRGVMAGQGVGGQVVALPVDLEGAQVSQVAAPS
ncbi:homoserine kinase [Deinococcus radiophilus]|uniref:homoserine kinase n=1 Tax=Deinococcus radiophilus TaxID=32062 RepID=UPI001E4E64EE|nr:homoserine kinase [Deinococcus radiophilus]UFA50280.1 homoserine kinase [Deinococcus radiophilus]